MRERKTRKILLRGMRRAYTINCSLQTVDRCSGYYVFPLQNVHDHPRERIVPRLNRVELDLFRIVGI